MEVVNFILASPVEPSLTCKNPKERGVISHFNTYGNQLALNLNNFIGLCHHRDGFKLESLN